ncbi:hypothetical protein [Tenacibaculum aestuarii]|uniref:hypothetical protein n=1 Tax=Tenacibaculum aestuarii TaxID=362781 RepID=UPI0038937C89
MQPKTEQPKLKRVLTVANILNQNIVRIPFEDDSDWYKAYKRPQNRGIWFMWGGSGSGKSTKAMMTAKKLAQYDKTLYATQEEETDDSDFVDRVELLKMQDVKNNFHAQSYTLQELDEYLEKRGSAHTVVMDSAPYYFKTWEEYYLFKKKWATKKLIIIIGHAEGKNPSTELQKRIMYDAKMKIFISGYLATCKGRTIGPNGGRFIIWKEGYEKLHGANSTKKEN